MPMSFRVWATIKAGRFGECGSFGSSHRVARLLSHQGLPPGRVRKRRAPALGPAARPRVDARRLERPVRRVTHRRGARNRNPVHRCRCADAYGQRPGRGALRLPWTSVASGARCVSGKTRVPRTTRATRPPRGSRRWSAGPCGSCASRTMGCERIGIQTTFAGKLGSRNGPYVEPKRAVG